MRPVVYPGDFLSRETPPALEQFAHRFLAEGDSWFTIGTLNFFDASNLLFELEFEHTSAWSRAPIPATRFSTWSTSGRMRTFASC